MLLTFLGQRADAQWAAEQSNLKHSPSPVPAEIDSRRALQPPLHFLYLKWWCSSLNTIGPHTEKETLITVKNYPLLREKAENLTVRRGRSSSRTGVRTGSALTLAQAKPQPWLTWPREEGKESLEATLHSLSAANARSSSPAPLTSPASSPPPSLSSREGRAHPNGVFPTFFLQTGVALSVGLKREPWQYG